MSDTDRTSTFKREDEEVVRRKDGAKTVDEAVDMLRRRIAQRGRYPYSGLAHDALSLLRSRIEEAWTENADLRRQLEEARAALERYDTALASEFEAARQRVRALYSNERKGTVS